VFGSSKYLTAGVAVAEFPGGVRPFALSISLVFWAFSAGCYWLAGPYISAEVTFAGSAGENS